MKRRPPLLVRLVDGGFGNKSLEGEGGEKEGRGGGEEGMRLGWHSACGLNITKNPS